jgi:hypothetical protein
VSSRRHTLNVTPHSSAFERLFGGGAIVIIHPHAASHAGDAYAMKGLGHRRVL